MIQIEESRPSPKMSTVTQSSYTYMGQKRKMSVIAKRMVSARSLEWTSLLVQLVASGVCLIASMAVISAKLQSTSIYPDKQFVSLDWWSFCILSFMMIFATVFSMFGLSNHKRTFLYPHLMLLIIYCVFVGRVLIRVVIELEMAESSWAFGVSVLILAGLPEAIGALSSRTPHSDGKWLSE